jgi:PKD repeat protein
LSKNPATGRIAKALLITSFVLLGTLLAAPIATSNIDSHALGITQSATATDSSSPQQSATNSQTVTALPLLAGNFGVCGNLPLGWNCGNLHSGAPSPSSAQIVTGVFQSRQSNPGLGGSNDYYYSTTQKGTFPWTPCSAPATGVIPSGVSSVSVNFTSLSYNPGSSPSSDRYHIYIALYYWLPNGSVSAAGSTYQCLDTQVRVENIGGTFSPIGSTATYNPGDSFGWDNVTLQISPGQTGTLTANVANQCLQDLMAWGLPTNTPCQLAGIEIGTEGYQFQELDVNWYDVSLNVGSIPLSTSFTFQPATPIVNTPVTFTATTIGGAAPYSVAWNFGDGTTGTGTPTVHIYTTAGSFTVTETVIDSSTPAQSTTSSQSLTVYTILPLSTTFSVSSSSPQVGQAVTFTASATGGTPPYTYSVAFGDGGMGSGTSVTYTYSAPGSYTATVIVTDSASPQASLSKTVTVSVQTLVPPVLTIPSNQTVPAGTWINFTIAATSSNSGGTITLSATDLPTGANFDPATGRFSWKPSSTQTGSYTVIFIATDSSSPSTPTSKPMGIQVNQAAPSGSNGGNGGSGGGSNGSCLFCGIVPTISADISLFVIGGILGIIASLTLLTIRARASQERTKKRLRI